MLNQKLSPFSLVSISIATAVFLNAGRADEPVKPEASQPAAAVPVAPAAPPEIKREPLPPITWTDAEIEKISKMLIGKWKAAVPSTEGDSTSTVDVGLFIERVRSDEIPDLLYVESGRVDSLQAPFRQAFYQVFRFKDGLRLRTYDLTKQLGGSMVGMWTNPDAFPPVKRTDLVATIDIDLKPDGDGYAGTTPYPFPTGRGKAVEMTSEVSIKPGELYIADRGFDAKGNIVWGAPTDTKVKFSNFEPPLDTWKTDKGVFVIEYRRSSDEMVCKEDDQIKVHYLGFLKNGFRFDSSLDKVPPNPLTFTVSEQQLIPGLVQALLGANVGTIRRAYLPYEQAYGQYGNSRARIPPNADLYFDFEVIGLERPTGPRRSIPSGAPQVNRPTAAPAAPAEPSQPK